MKKRILIPVIAILALYLLYLFIRVSDNPSFCNSCHIMKPYYENWLSSTHNRTSCIDCHYRKGFSGYMEGKFRLLAEMIRYFAGAYHVKLHSKIDDENCMKCHIKEELEIGEVLFARRIKFKHVKHYEGEIRGVRLACQSCHSELVQGRHTAVNKNVCIICHFAGREAREPVGGCGACHGPPREIMLVRGIKFSHLKYVETGIDCRTCHIHVTEGTGGISHEKCMQCHVEKDIEYKDHIFLHNVHVTKQKIRCGQCHGEIKHRKVEMSYALSPKCEECHGGKHTLQERLYIGTGAIDVPVTPDPMFLSGVSCIGCHQVKEEKIVFGHRSIFTLASPEICKDCHGKGYDRLAYIWQEGIKDRIERLGERVNRIVALSSAINIPVNISLIKQNFDFLKEDKSYGIHNIKYAHLILNRIEEEVDRAETKIFKSNKKKLSLEKLFERDPECLSCHFGVEKHRVKIKNRVFDHYPHLYKNSCGVCHSKKNHGVTYRGSYKCNSCHHRKADNCKHCHEIQYKVYNGKFHNLSPDVMAEAEIGCADCHEKDGVIKKPGENFCIDCHDEEYEIDFLEKRESIKKMFDKIDRELDVAENKIYKNPGKYKGEILEFMKVIYKFNEFKQDNSLGAHNLMEYEDYLEEVKNKIEKF